MNSKEKALNELKEFKELYYGSLPNRIGHNYFRAI
jgi:hypothetical protein